MRQFYCKIVITLNHTLIISIKFLSPLSQNYQFVLFSFIQIEMNFQQSMNILIDLHMTHKFLYLYDHHYFCSESITFLHTWVS